MGMERRDRRGQERTGEETGQKRAGEDIQTCTSCGFGQT